MEKDPRIKFPHTSSRILDYKMKLKNPRNHLVLALGVDSRERIFLIGLVVERMIE